MRGIAGLVMVALLVAAQGFQAAALRACPHHTGSGHSAVDEAGAPPGGGTAHLPPASETPSDEHDSGSHEGPCDCLGPCGATGTVQAPSPLAESAFVTVAARRAIQREAPGTAVTLRTLPFALPYPNAPPA